MIVPVYRLEKVRSKHAHQVVVFTCGTYDLLHYGHVQFLEWCKQQGDVLYVAVNSDRLTRLRKGPTRPLVHEHDRLRMVDALKVVDYVSLKKKAPNSRLASMITAERLQPDIIVLGHDWAADELEEWHERFPDTTIIVGPEREPGRSTTAIIETVRERHA